MQKDLPIRGGRGGQRGDRGRGQGSDRGRGRGDGGYSRGGQDRGGYGGGRGGRGGGRGGPVAIFSHDPPIAAVIDPAVTKMENQQVTKTAGSKVTSLPPRPAYGSKGREVVLWANYFRLRLQDKTTLQRYAIEVKEVSRANAVPAKLAKRVVEIFIEESGLGTGVVTDFRSTLLSLQPLVLPSNQSTVVYWAEGMAEPEENARRFIVRLLHTGILSVSDVLDGTSSSQGSSLLGSKQELISALNVVVGHSPKADSTVTSLSNNRHYAISGRLSQSMPLGSGLEAMRGFFFSVRAATGRLLVNTQIKSMAFYESGPLTAVAGSFLGQNKRNLSALRQFLKKVRVQVTHIQRVDRRGNAVPRFKTIQGFATPADGASLAHPPRVRSHGAGPSQVEFFLQSSTPAPASAGKKGKKVPAAGPSTSVNGKYISVKEFFRQNYGLQNIDDNLPVINVGTVQEPSYLPMEVCRVSTGQSAKAKLSPAQTQSMIRFAVRKPFENARSIVTTGAQMLGFDPNIAHLTSFGINVDPHMVAVPGRVLPGPEINYAKQNTVRPVAANWNLQSSQFVRPARLTRWVSLVINGKSFWPNEAAVQEQLNNTLSPVLRKMGMQCENIMRGLMIQVSANDHEEQIDNAIGRFSNHATNRPELVVVILPKDATALYNRVKLACDVRHGLLNVCMADQKMFSANEQYFANVALKINLKLGGANHLLAPARLGIVGEGKTMIVGLDVTHPSPGSSADAPSVAAIVASVDASLAQWPGALRTQAGRQEMVQTLRELFKSRLELWRRKNEDALPQNILVYRDGVSEGQYQLILDHELPAMREACQKMYPATETKAGRPRISIVVVGKRHHTRFYATQSNNADRSGNPQSGTIVDRGVTEAANWDFFLQAHSAIQGTARPAHYFVVHDEVFRAVAVKPPFTHAADVLEDLTHNLCYLFGRATKAVSLCPPAYYADLACERARCYLADAFAPAAMSDNASMTTGRSGSTSDGLTVELHPRIKDAMFYI